MKGGIRLACRMISPIFPIDDSEALCEDHEKDELVNRELSNIIGLLVLKGGRLVALASGLVQIVTHIEIDNTPEEMVKESLEQTIQSIGQTKQQTKFENVSKIS